MVKTVMTTLADCAGVSVAVLVPVCHLITLKHIKSAAHCDILQLELIGLPPRQKSICALRCALILISSPKLIEID